jgi:hypothetical protein
VEPELPTFPGILRSPPVFSKVRIARYLVLCVIFCRSLFVLFRLVIVLSVLLRFTDHDYPFGIMGTYCLGFFSIVFCW